jgi:hypothetical protein
VPHATPIKIPELEFTQLHAAAQWLCPADRNQFLAAVASELAGRELGEGATARAIARAFKAFYRPIEVPDEPQQLRKLTYGSNKLAAKYDTREAHRQRRQRSDAR